MTVERFRPDLALIASLIPAGSRVLDLGCGNGDLMALLQARAAPEPASTWTRSACWRACDAASM